jgi:hypothetical protein
MPSRQAARDDARQITHSVSAYREPLANDEREESRPAPRAGAASPERNTIASTGADPVRAGAGLTGASEVSSSVAGMESRHHAATAFNAAPIPTVSATPTSGISTKPAIAQPIAAPAVLSP